jgi:hypothetical protein
MHLGLRSLVVLSMLAVGCAGRSDDAGESGDALTDEIVFTASSGVTIEKPVANANSQKEADDANEKLRNENLPTLAAQAKARSETQCNLVTGANGRIIDAGTPKPRDYRTNPTNWVLEVSLDSKCSAPRDALMARLDDIARMLDTNSGDIRELPATARAALAALQGDAVAPLVKVLRTKVGPDGKLITDEGNLIINKLAYELTLLEDIAMPTPDVMTTLETLRDGVDHLAPDANGLAWLKDMVKHAIDKISAKQ